MPDKERYVQEMSRVLKPGGRIVIATWCEREADPPFTPEVRLNRPNAAASVIWFMRFSAVGEMLPPTTRLPTPHTLPRHRPEMLLHPKHFACTSLKLIVPRSLPLF